MGQGINWPRPDELMRKVASGGSLTSSEQLALKSRSFYGPTQLLELAKGETEFNKKPQVTIMYILDRVLDECEDGTLLLEEKLKAKNDFSYCLAEIIRREQGSDIDDILAGEKFKNAVQLISKGAIGDEAKVFVNEFGKGTPLREFNRFDQKIKGSMGYAIQTMATGMENFLRQGRLESLEDLEQYSYYVAGSVGDFLTELVELTDAVKLDTNNAQKFGRHLQLTNITKNIKEDYKAGRIYIPKNVCPEGMSLNYLMESDAQDARKARATAFEQMLSSARNTFTGSVDYVSSIPSQLSGYKAFCLVPLIMAERTLNLMRDAGAEPVFKGEESAIKMKGGAEQVAEIMRVSSEVAKDTSKTEELLTELKKAAEFLF
ncbi:MAG TPA: squalene/phytoene synthase family protein [Candidatus Nanoarchaeia archaeon]|nr:squalene/phytoene synthase family protein [Candidatus Nanoarchaeia archaeon]